LTHHFWIADSDSAASLAANLRVHAAPAIPLPTPAIIPFPLPINIGVGDATTSPLDLSGRLAYEAAYFGLLSPDLAAGIVVIAMPAR
jgi:hypothetical protein